MLCLLMVFAAVLFGDDKQPGEKTPDPKLAIKTILIEADKRYKAAIKECRSKKTSADREDCAESHVAEFADWIDSKNETPVEFECRVVNVVRDKETGGYVVVLSNPKELVAFQSSSESRPVFAKTEIRLPVEEDQKEGLEPGATVLVRSQLLIGLPARKHERSFPYLFCVQNDPIVMAGEGFNPGHPKFSAVPVSLDEVEFEVVKKVTRKAGK
jgi:hypothetical protein